MNFYKKAGDTHRYVVKYADTYQETLLVEISGKIKALHGAGLPIDLPKANPAQSRWGRVVSLRRAKKELREAKLEIIGQMLEEFENKNISKDSIIYRFILDEFHRARRGIL